MSVAISKITRAGQITLPKKIRGNKIFSKASAVSFEDRGNEVVIKPLRSQDTFEVTNDHWGIVMYTMRDWLGKENDDLVKLPKEL